MSLVIKLDCGERGGEGEEKDIESAQEEQEKDIEEEEEEEPENIILHWLTCVICCTFGPIYCIAELFYNCFKCCLECSKNNPFGTMILILFCIIGLPLIVWKTTTTKMAPSFGPSFVPSFVPSF